jgi:MFS transporter, DHA1 family, multidrug resistance protein
VAGRGRLAPGSAGFVALIAGFMTVTAMTIDINLPAVPAIAAALGADLTLAQLTVTAFFVGFAFGQAFWGPLSDRHGRRPALLAGLGVYLAATVACALAASIEAMLALRVVEGFGAGAGAVVGRAIIRDEFEGPQMARVMSLAMAAFITAPIVAPSIGAVILTFTDWRGIFWFLTLYGLVLLALAATVLGESLRRPDPDALRPGRLAGAMVAVFRDPASRRPAVAVVLTFATLTVYLTNAAAIFMDGHGLSPQAFGAVFAAVALCSAAGNLANSRLVRTVPLPRLVRLALLASGLAAAATLALAATGLGGYPALVAGFGAFFVCFGLIVPNAMALALAPHGRSAGSAAAALGFVHTVVPAAIASGVAALYDGTAVPS